MEVERYKMIYTKIISEKLNGEVPDDVQEIIDKEAKIL